MFAAAESGEVEIVDDRPGKPFPRPGCGDRNHQRGNRLDIHAHTIELKRDNSTGAALRQPLADVEQEEEKQPAFAGGEEIGYEEVLVGLSSGFIQELDEAGDEARKAPKKHLGRTKARHRRCRTGHRAVGFRSFCLAVCRTFECR